MATSASSIPLARPRGQGNVAQRLRPLHDQIALGRLRRRFGRGFVDDLGRRLGRGFAKLGELLQLLYLFGLRLVFEQQRPGLRALHLLFGEKAPELGRLRC